MAKTKQKPVKNLPELRFKMAEIFAALENDEMEVPKAKALTGVATTIINSLRVEQINNQLAGNVAGIDFLLTEKELEEKKQNQLGNGDSVI